MCLLNPLCLTELTPLCLASWRRLYFNLYTSIKVITRDLKIMHKNGAKNANKNAEKWAENANKNANKP